MHIDLGLLVDHLGAWIDDWVEDICSLSPCFEDPLSNAHEHRLFVTQSLKLRAQKVANIIERGRSILNRSSERRRMREAEIAASRVGLENAVGALLYGYEGPGEERQEGPRHDNDFVDIWRIQIAPTNEELVCKIPPYLPANIPNAPHTFPSDSIQRLLDVQFRLLREELT